MKDDARKKLPLSQRSVPFMPRSGSHGWRTVASKLNRSKWAVARCWPGSPAGTVTSIAPAATARQALNLMSTYDVSQLPVVEGADCVGSVSEGTLTAKALSDGALLERPVRDVMELPYPVLEDGLPLESLTAVLTREAPAALIRRNGQLAGIVTRYDVLRHVAGIR